MAKKLDIPTERRKAKLKAQMALDKVAIAEKKHRIALAKTELQSLNPPRKKD